MATIETIEEEGLLERATQIGERFHKHFSKLQERSPLIAEIRIKGAMIGVELNIEGAPLVQRCIEQGLLVNCTHGTVLRLLPALNLTDDLIDEGCEILSNILLKLTMEGAS